MRNVLIVVCAALCFCIAIAPAFAEAPTIPARIAAARTPVPSFKEVHRQYMRVSLNESGWKSLADQNGILESLLFGSGGRHPARAGKGTGYGIDYRKLMARMVRHSGRTFPRGSRFFRALSPGRIARLSKLRTRHNEWVSDIQLDCSEPASWNEGVQGSWLGYVKRCARLRETTAEFLKGEMDNHCTGQPTTWGSEEDTHRDGGPAEEGWREISCDWPFDPIEVEGMEIVSCTELRERAQENRGAKRALLNSMSCARNRFWTWMKGGPLAMR